MITATSVNTGGLGRFGNQLFTIAGVIGIALRSGQPYGFPQWINQDDVLFGGQAIPMDQYFVNPLPKWVPGAYTDYGYFWGYRDIQLPTGNWNINAHLQDYRYFEHCIEVIRETFRMKDEGPQLDAVAIHYRAKDYTKGKHTYHPRLEADYYRAAMSMFPLDTKFILFSDDTDEFRQMIDGVYHIANGTYIEDFKLMKRCKSFITANSSFSLMAAILGEHPEKKIICPKLWFGTDADITFDGYPRGAVVV